MTNGPHNTHTTTPSRDGHQVTSMVTIVNASTPQFRRQNIDTSNRVYHLLPLCAAVKMNLGTFFLSFSLFTKFFTLRLMYRDKDNGPHTTHTITPFRDNHHVTYVSFWQLFFHFAYSTNDYLQTTNDNIVKRSDNNNDEDESWTTTMMMRRMRRRWTTTMMNDEGVIVGYVFFILFFILLTRHITAGLDDWDLKYCWRRMGL